VRERGRSTTRHCMPNRSLPPWPPRRHINVNTTAAPAKTTTPRPPRTAAFNPPPVPVGTLGSTNVITEEPVLSSP